MQPPFPMLSSYPSFRASLKAVFSAASTAEDEKRKKGFAVCRGGCFITELSHPGSQNVNKDVLHNRHVLLNSRQTCPVVHHVSKTFIVPTGNNTSMDTMVAGVTPRQEPCSAPTGISVFMLKPVKYTLQCIVKINENVNRSRIRRTSRASEQPTSYHAINEITSMWSPEQLTPFH